MRGLEWRGLGQLGVQSRGSEKETGDGLGGREEMDGDAEEGGSRSGREMTRTIWDTPSLGCLSISQAELSGAGCRE